MTRWIEDERVDSLFVLCSVVIRGGGVPTTLPVRQVLCGNDVVQESQSPFPSTFFSEECTQHQGNELIS